MGPTVQTFVARNDSSKANPEGLLPNPNSPGDELVQLFQRKGIGPGELSALVGAHTSAKQFAFDPSRAGTPLDSSPGTWDVEFYGQVLEKSAPFVLPSDIQLSQNAATGPSFKQFAGNQMMWSAAFAPSMTKLSLLGVDKSGLIDCTSALPGSRGYVKRQPVKRTWWTPSIKW